MAQVRRSKRLCAQGGSHRTSTTIGTLPDDVLLEIFDSYRSPPCDRPCLYQDSVSYCTAWPWHLLVHICRKWRQIVFESPLRLNLQILCTHRTPVKKSLSIWPAFPIAISYHPPGRSKRTLGQGNVIDALKHPDRVCYVSLDVTVPQLGRMATVMQKPFPVLAHLNASLVSGNAPVLPANFLGGSAPSLQTIYLYGIPFPALPSLLLSATHLVKLELRKIPPTGYISPEAMVASLVALPRLETFIIQFQSATSRPARIRPPPVTRTILPSLIYFRFEGASEYLEDLVTQIDGPQLDQIFTLFLNQLVDIQVARLSEFIDRSNGPESNSSNVAHVVFYSTGVAFIVYGDASSNRRLVWNNLFFRADWQASHITQVLGQFSAAFSNAGHLTLVTGFMEDRQLDGMVDVEWLLLLRQFSTVRTLHVSRELARHVALALEGIPTEMVKEVLPSLDLISLEGQLASSIKKFVVARGVSGRPVTAIDITIGAQ